MRRGGLEPLLALGVPPGEARILLHSNPERLRTVHTLIYDAEGAMREHLEASV